MTHPIFTRKLVPFGKMLYFMMVQVIVNPHVTNIETETPSAPLDSRYLSFDAIEHVL